ncbi:MAG TPA: protein translocase subunit SecD [Anaerolineae bacterium]|nr:protein translocase subunit SecD [Anaerolineae bacterium]
MSGRTRLWFTIIVVIAFAAMMITFMPMQSISYPSLGININTTLREGLDLSGGSQVLLQATNCSGDNLSDRMDNAKRIIEARVNGLGVTEPIVQLAGDCRILVELPAVGNPAEAISLVQQTGRLEFVDAGADYYPEGAIIRTTGNPSPKASAGQDTGVITPTATVTSTETVTTGLPSGQTQIPDKVYNTIVTGADLDPTALKVGLGGVGNNQPEVAFKIVGQAAQTFGAFTQGNNEQTLGRQYFMCIVLDNVVQSCPSVKQPLPSGEGVITVGQGGVDEANRLVNLLRYGALPISLEIAQSQTIGPTLGGDSVRASIIAGLIGLSVVALFMMLYYRLPGVIAVIALLLYATILLALFKLLGVVLTLPGIAGFILSVGVAVDANILIFERLREELRNGRRLSTAVSVGFERAWTSIRDSNISTLITCGILFWFGNAFGASVVKGFAVTLALGVFVSLFTAVFVTRLLLHLVLDRMNYTAHARLFGV